MIWEVLKNAREGKCMTQTNLGLQVGVSSTAISTYEKNMPYWYDVVVGICRELDITPNTLFSWQSDKKDVNIKDGTIKKSVEDPGVRIDYDDALLVVGVLDERERELRKQLQSSGKIDVKVVNDINYMIDLRELIERRIADAGYEDVKP